MGSRKISAIVVSSITLVFILSMIVLTQAVTGSIFGLWVEYWLKVWVPGQVPVGFRVVSRELVSLFMNILLLKATCLCSR